MIDELVNKYLNEMARRKHKGRRGPEGDLIYRGFLISHTDDKRSYYNYQASLLKPKDGKRLTANGMTKKACYDMIDDMLDNGMKDGVKI